MKNRIVLLLMAVAVVFFYKPVQVFAQHKNPIEGIWYNAEKDAKIQIYLAKDGHYYGKIVWLKNPDRDGKPKLDINNVKESLQSRPIMGLLLLKHFKQDGDNYFTDGTIYDPKNGKTYDCNITQKGMDKLSIRGYIGISLIGRTTTWTRTEL